MDSDGTGAPDKSDEDFQVLSTIIGTLTPLDDARRRRIMQTIMTFFGLDAGLLGTSGAPTPRPTAPPSGMSFSEDRALSPKEFLLEKRPTTELDRVVCLAFYLTHYRDTPHFKTLDISKLNTEAAQVKFSNAARAVDNAAKAGFLVPAVKGSKQLSAMAEQYVQALPDRAAAKSAIAEYRPRRRSRKARRSPRDQQP